jgi:hypothetical protein
MRIPLRLVTLSTLLILTACASIPGSQEQTDAPPVVESPLPDTSERLPEAVEPDDSSVAHPSNDGSSAPDPAPESLVIQFADAWLGSSDEMRNQLYQKARTDYEQSGHFDALVRLGLLTTLRGNDRAAVSRVSDEVRRQLEKNAGEHQLAPLARVVLRILEENARTIGRLTTQNETLQRQLDELKAIEEQLRERGGAEPIQAP